MMIKIEDPFIITFWDNNTISSNLLIIRQYTMAKSKSKKTLKVVRLKKKVGSQANLPFDQLTAHFHQYFPQKIVSFEKMKNKNKYCS